MGMDDDGNGLQAHGVEGLCGVGGLVCLHLYDGARGWHRRETTWRGDSNFVLRAHKPVVPKVFVMTRVMGCIQNLLPNGSVK